jgi:hypothetical protein
MMRRMSSSRTSGISGFGRLRVGAGAPGLDIPAEQAGDRGSGNQGSSSQEHDGKAAGRGNTKGSDAGSKKLDGSEKLEAPGDILARGAETRAAHAKSLESAGLEVDEPGLSLVQQRDELLVQVDELSGVLRFMGAGHPQRAETEARLQQLRQILTRLEEELAHRNR